jgi:hypothetical protein
MRSASAAQTSPVRGDPEATQKAACVPKSFTNRVFVRGRHVLKLALIAVHK